MIVKYLPRTGLSTDVLARRPRTAGAAGLVLVALLVPVLSALNGANGTLSLSIPLLFLVPVVFSSAFGGMPAGALVGCAAIVVWDWYFIPPVHQLTIASARDAVALLVFLFVALSVGQLATLARRRTDEAVRRARSSSALYDLSVGLIAGRMEDDLLGTLAERLRTAFELEACAVLMPGPGGRWDSVAAAGQMPDTLQVTHSRNVAAIAAQAHQRGQECRLGAAAGGRHRRDRIRRPRAGFELARFIPLRVADRSVGVLEIVPHAAQTLDVEREHLLATFANGAAIALEQARLARQEQAATVARESDRLKSALLSSVSHDLRTPLAGIKAAATSLLQDDVQWSDEDRRAFASDINAEADRLTRLVSNLLDLSRIEAGAIRPVKEWENVGGLIDRVVTRMRPWLTGHTLECDVAVDLPPVKLDAVEVEQVLANLLENAGKYAPPGSPIAIGARAQQRSDGAQRLRITVTDHGPGIPEAERGRIFDKFYRLSGTTARAPGTGMGLAIVKGLVEAHGGRVWVESPADHGSVFVVELPIERAAQDVVEARAAPGNVKMV